MKNSIFSHLRDSICRCALCLEHDSSGAEMEFTFRFCLSRTWRSGQIKHNVRICLWVKHWQPPRRLNMAVISGLTSAMNRSMSSFLWKTNARRSWNEMWFSTYLANWGSFTLICETRNVLACKCITDGCQISKASVPDGKLLQINSSRILRPLWDKWRSTFSMKLRGVKVKCWLTGTHHQHHGFVDISNKELSVLSEPLEGGVCVPVASSQLLLFGFHHVVHIVELFLQS